VFISGADLPAKPEPDVFLQATHVLDQSIERFIVIEDSPPGVKAAKRARMMCIAVATNQPKSELMMADLVLEDFTRPLMDVLNFLGIE
jgi:beta-phosphoglucomutase-like phosphatase (HAD superfamily)